MRGMQRNLRECLVCGMPVEAGRLQLDDLPPHKICPKCDSDVYAQSDGTRLVRDIAHQGETLGRAMEKLDQALLEAWQGHYRSLLLVTGGGVIRNEVLGQLHYYRQLGYLLNYDEQQPNRGVLLVYLRG
jgi:hypothetical protein